MTVIKTIRSTRGSLRVLKTFDEEVVETYVASVIVVQIGKNV